MSQRTILSALLAMSAFAGTAVGIAPASRAQDARISSRLYSPDEIVRVEGKLNVQATIAFGEGEKIENVAVGDSESWQIAPNKRADLLFIKPLTETARTNMTVVTDRHTYFFDLVASPKAQPLYALRFTYATPAPAPVPAAVVAAVPVTAQPAAAASDPAAVQPSAAEQRAQARRVAAAASAARAAEAKRIDDQRKAERRAARARAAAEAKRAADARSAERAAQRAAQTNTATAPAAGDGAPAQVSAASAAAPAWKRSGPRELMPRTIYDDGRATYAVWPAGQPLPQMLVADAQGREVPVEFAVDGEKIVIPGVPGRIILRANGRSGTLEPGQPAVAARPASAGQ